MSQQQTYEVTAPDGTKLEVTGPAGASHEEVIRQAQALYQPKAESPLTAVLAAQKAKYPTEAEGAKPVPSTLDTALRFSGIPGLIEAGKGALKGVESTVHGGGELVRQIPGMAALDEAAPKIPYARPGPPANPAQQVGFHGEQAAEFLLPGAVAKNAGVANKAALAALEAVGASGVAKVQGGDPLTAGAVSGTMSAVSPALGVVVDKLPVAVMNNYLRPLAKSFRFGKDPGRAAVEEKIMAPTVGAFIAKAKTIRKGIGAEIETVLKAASNAPKVDIKPLLSPIDEAVKQAAKANDQELVNQLVRFKDSLTDILVPDTAGKIVKTGVKRPTVLDPYRTTMVKREIGEGTSWSGQTYDKALNQVKAKVYRNLDAAVDQSVPKVADLNRRYGNLLEAEKSAERMKTLSGAQLKDLVPASLGFAGYGIPGAAAAVLAKKGLATAGGATMASQLIHRSPEAAPAAKAALLAISQKANARRQP